MQAARIFTLNSKTSSSVARFFGSSNVPSQLSNVIRGSDVRWRGRSFATLIPSDSPSQDSPDPQKPQKRISKEKRRALIVAFVERYRSLNSGKYPTAKATMKEVGGGYYLVRQIVQELKYKESSTSNESFSEKVVPKEECQPPANAEEMPSSADTLDSHIVEEQHYDSQQSPTNKDHASLEKVESKEECQSSVKAEESPSSGENLGLKIRCEQESDSQKSSSTIGDQSSINRIDTHQTELGKDVLHPHSEKAEDSGPERGIVQKDGQEASKSNTEIVQETRQTELGKVVLDPSTEKELISGPEREIVQEDGQEADKSDTEIVQKADQEPSTSDNISRNISREEKDPLQKRSLWGELRSFADGIISLWRKP